MKFKLEFTFDISDSSLLIDANDGRSEEYTSLEDVPEDTLMDVVYNYLDAVHYYGNLDIEGISFSQEDSPNTMTMCSETYDAEEKNPLAGGMYHIELVRPVTREEIEEDNSRWCGYEIGDNTNAFHSPEDVIALAKEVCKARFKGNWILKIVDYSGKDLDEEILIDKL